MYNGIIENYTTVKEWLISEGHKFQSEKDTEVVAHLVEHYHKGGLKSAVHKALERIRGSYALCKRAKQRVFLFPPVGLRESLEPLA